MSRDADTVQANMSAWTNFSRICGSGVDEMCVCFGEYPSNVHYERYADYEVP